MKLNCNHCEKTTDALKLKKIGDREYLLCKSCLKESDYAEFTIGGKFIPGVQVGSGQRHASLQ